MKVNVIVADRKSAAVANREFEFTSFGELKKEVKDFIDTLPFYKIFVEVTPLDFEPDADQKELIRMVEEED